MLDKIKTFLNSTWLWFLALVGGVMYLWLKEKDLEREITESKAVKEIQDAQEQVKEADSASTSAEQHFEQLSEQYKQSNPND